jgi:hypothetical protein
MSYDVDDLFLFAKITAYHSLNDAAKELGLTASYITRFIQKLEGELGHPLIITTRNGFVPSYFGSALGNRFGSYNELFNLELMNSLSLFKRYKATFNLYLTSLVADFAIKNLLEIAKEFDGVSFNFFQHSGETFSKDFLTNAQFGIVSFPSRNITDKYVAENSTLINSAYYEVVCTEEYVKNYGAPSTLEQLQEHSSRIIASSNRPIYASLGSDGTDPVLITSQPAISSNGGMLNDLIRTNHYIGVILVLPLIHNDLITILPKYNFGIVYGYLFENKLLTRQYPKELINIIRKNILNSCTELMNLVR